MFQTKNILKYMFFICITQYENAMSNRGRNMRKYRLRVKKSVKNIWAGIKNHSDMRKKSFCFLNILYIQKISTHIGMTHQSKKNIWEKRASSEKYKSGDFPKNISGKLRVNNFFWFTSTLEANAQGSFDINSHKDHFILGAS